MNREEIVQGVCECLMDVVDVDLDTIKESDRIIEDLGADSLDLLDLIFRLEKRFKIKIAPGDIERRARTELGDIPLEKDGQYTPQALEKLRKDMPEVPPEELGDGMRVESLPRVFRVATFANIVSRLLEEKDG